MLVPFKLIFSHQRIDLSHDAGSPVASTLRSTTSTSSWVGSAGCRSWVGFVEQSADLAQRHLGDALALVLRDPLLGDGLESVVLLDPGAGGIDLLLARGISPGREQPRLVAARPGIGEVYVQPGAESECPMRVEITVLIRHSFVPLDAAPATAMRDLAELVELAALRRLRELKHTRYYLNIDR